MISFNTHVCKDKNLFEITYYTDDYDNYKYIQEIIREQMDNEKSERHKRPICGIDNGICLQERCTKSFNEKGCMYLKGVYKR